MLLLSELYSNPVNIVAVILFVVKMHFAFSCLFVQITSQTVQ